MAIIFSNELILLLRPATWLPVVFGTSDDGHPLSLSLDQLGVRYAQENSDHIICAYHKMGAEVLSTKVMWFLIPGVRVCALS